MIEDDEDNVDGHGERPKDVGNGEPALLDQGLTTWILIGSIHLQTERLEAAQPRLITGNWPTDGYHRGDKVEQIVKCIHEHDPMRRTAEVRRIAKGHEDGGHAQERQGRGRPPSNGQPVQLVVRKLHRELGVPWQGPDDDR